MNIIGNVKGKRIIILDDMVDTAGTLCRQLKAMKEEGALEVSVAVRILSCPAALERIENPRLKNYRNRYYTA